MLLLFVSKPIRNTLVEREHFKRKFIHRYLVVRHWGILVPKGMHRVILEVFLQTSNPRYSAIPDHWKKKQGWGLFYWNAIASLTSSWTFRLLLRLFFELSIVYYFYLHDFYCKSLASIASILQFINKEWLWLVTSILTFAKTCIICSLLSLIWASFASLSSFLNVAIKLVSRSSMRVLNELKLVFVNCQEDRCKRAQNLIGHVWHITTQGLLDFLRDFRKNVLFLRILNVRILGLSDEFILNFDHGISHLGNLLLLLESIGCEYVALFESLA